MIGYDTWHFSYYIHSLPPTHVTHTSTHTSTHTHSLSPIHTRHIHCPHTHLLSLSHPHTSHPHIHTHTHILSLSQFVLPLIIHLVDAIINRRLRFGYDIGKGFVVGEEEMLLSFDRIGSVVHKNIAQELRRRAESTRLSVIQSLGESTPCCS